MFLKQFGKIPGKKPTWPSSQLQIVFQQLNTLNASFVLKPDFHNCAQSLSDI